MLVDRPRRIAELWPIVDELTAVHGVVTAAFVPAYRERAGEVEHGRLTVRSTDDVAALYRGEELARAPVAAAISTATPEGEWARALTDEIREFAETHGRPRPLIRVTLTGGEQFFLAALEPRPGDGFVTLPHPHRPDRVAGTEGAVLPALVVPLAGIAKVEMLAHVPRGTRSDVGFLLPPGDRDAGDA